MALRGAITYTGGPEMAARNVAPFAKDALRDLGRWWHEKILPGHFTTAAETLYHYQPRSARYSRSKARRFGHRNPLVFRGDLKRMVSRMARISSTSKGVTVRLSGPRYLYQYRKSYAQPDKGAELTATSAGEVETMARTLDEILTRRIQNDPGRLTRKFGA